MQCKGAYSPLNEPVRGTAPFQNGFSRLKGLSVVSTAETAQTIETLETMF
jgi:hypothetical protein